VCSTIAGYQATNSAVGVAPAPCLSRYTYFRKTPRLTARDAPTREIPVIRPARHGSVMPINQERHVALVLAATSIAERKSAA